MGYWKSKVVPAINKVFKKDTAKKTAAAAEACKSFDESKEEINKEFEEKKAELEPLVVEIYQASSTEIKSLVKDPKEAGLKKHSSLVQKFLEQLVKIEFPGSKAVSEASSKYGANNVSVAVFFIFEKVSSFIVEEEKPAEVVETRDQSIVESDDLKKQPEAETSSSQVLEEEPPAKAEAEAEEATPQPSKP